MEQIILNKGSYIQFSVSESQKLFARSLVEFSLQNHFVPNIWDKHRQSVPQTRMLRFTGSLGEIVFADTYHLARPARSFGASDGQDFGADFSLTGEGYSFSIDIKSMRRQSGVLAGHYVLNIPASQLRRRDSKTTHYFCISFHQCLKSGTIASLLGFIDKQSLLAGLTGRLYKAGTRRVRADGSHFHFHEDTYEVLFSEIDPPVLTPYIRSINDFCTLSMK